MKSQSRNGIKTIYNFKWTSSSYKKSVCKHSVDSVEEFSEFHAFLEHTKTPVHLNLAVEESPGNSSRSKLPSPKFSIEEQKEWPNHIGNPRVLPCIKKWIALADLSVYGLKGADNLSPIAIGLHEELQCITCCFTRWLSHAVWRTKSRLFHWKFQTRKFRAKV